MAIYFGLDQWRDRENTANRQVVCYGDSWFWLPNIGVSNIPQRLSAHWPGIDWIVIGGNGMRLADPLQIYWYELQQVSQDLQGMAAAVLVSGGGNDLVAMRPNPNNNHLDDYGLEDDAITVAKRCDDALCKIASLFNGTDYFITHTYAVPVRFGVPFDGVIGPWIKPLLDAYDVNSGDYGGTSRLILNILRRRTESLSVPISCIDTLDKMQSPSDWHDEMHGSKSGLDGLMPDWVSDLSKYLGKSV